MKTYDATVTREGRWWMVEIPELDGLTQTRRLDEVEQVAREYVAVTVDVALSQVAVEISGIEAGGHDLLDAKTLVDDLRAQAKQLETLVADFSREFASALTNADIPVRDVSSVLGVSHQRVSQLVKEAGEEPSELAEVVREVSARRRNDLLIRGKDGRVLRIVEVVPPTAGQKPTAARSAARQSKIAKNPQRSKRSGAAVRVGPGEPV